MPEQQPRRRRHHLLDTGGPATDKGISNRSPRADPAHPARSAPPARRPDLDPRTPPADRPELVTLATTPPSPSTPEPLPTTNRNQLTPAVVLKRLRLGPPRS